MTRSAPLVGAVLALCVVAVLGCSDSSVSPSFHEWAAPRWTAVNEEADFHRQLLSRLATSTPGFPGAGASRTRGVAVWVSSADEATSAYALVSHLRSVSSLSVEVWHAGLFTNESASAFEAMANVRVRDLFTVVPKESVPSTVGADGIARLGAQALVILHSRFREVLFVTATTMVVTDPSSLFSSAAYVASGVLMWSTPYATAGSNPMWSIAGVQCTPLSQWEQTGNLILINKEQAWSVLHMAATLRGSVAYASMMEGDNNLFRFAMMLVAPNGVDAARVVFPPTPAGDFYVIAGERQMCAHSLMYAAPDATRMFVSLLNNEMLAAGSQVVSMKCYAGVSSRTVEVLPESLVSSIIREQLSAPMMALTLGSVPNACSVRLSDAEIESRVRANPSQWITIDKFGQGQTVDIRISYGERTKDCGDWFRCGAYGWNNMDLFIKFFNVSNSAYRGAQIDVRTKTNLNYGIGNETFIQVYRAQGPSACDYPTPGSTETKVSLFNMPARSWFIVGVAWGPPRQQTSIRDIVLSIRYNTPIVGTDDSATNIVEAVTL